MDVVFKDDNGDSYILEMQNAHQDYFEDRALVYSARLLSEQKQKGSDWKDRIKGVYTICLLNFKLEEYPLFRTDLIISDEILHKRYYPNFKIIIIQFPRCEIQKVDAKSSIYEKSLYLLKKMNSMKYITKEEVGLFDTPALQRLLELAKVSELSEDDRIAYITLEHQHEAQLDAIATAKRLAIKEGSEAGFKEGSKAGFKEGKEVGFKRGREEGREEGLIFAAVNMKQAGMNINEISKITGLKVDDINKL